MNEDTFWTLIEDAGRHLQPPSPNAPDRQSEHLQAALMALGPEACLAFDAILTEKLGASYRWDLWGAAHLLMGGCSDDGFDYFRGWLIGRGRAIFEAALADPETLIAFAGAETEQEDLLYAAWQAYESLVGEEPPLHTLNFMHHEMGEPWEESDLPTRYPRLWAASSAA